MNILYESSPPMFYILVFAFGCIIGSFLNVCIVRMPKEVSVIWGRSKCLHCNTKLKWYLNIPVLSYIWIGGKCDSCRAPVSIQYPLVEIGTGLIYCLLLAWFGPSKQWVAYCVLFSGFLVLSIVDLQHRIIPDEISLGGIPAGFLAAIWTGDVPWWSSILGMLLGGGLFLAVAVLYEKLTKREGLGGGDIKLLAALGAWLGHASILPIIILSTSLGSVIGIIYMAATRKNTQAAIPFGPFLVLAASVYVFLKEPILSLFYGG